MGFDIYNEIFIEIVKKNFEIQKKNSWQNLATTLWIQNIGAC